MKQETKDKLHSVIGKTLIHITFVILFPLIKILDCILRLVECILGPEEKYIASNV